MNKEKKKRKDAFWGMHFDFHVSGETKNVGAMTDEAMVQQIIDKVDPDYLQTDCKGCPGYSSYPTKVGTPAPGLVKDRDTLKIWRDVTARNNVGLYMHYLGVLEDLSIEQHPGWASINEDGEPNPHVNSVLSGFGEELLIPQLLELAGEYHVDGVWVDGDSWAAAVDYGEKMFELFIKESGAGIAKPPKKGEAFFREYVDFNRRVTRKYIKNYVDRIHEKYPDFEIAVNWAYSSFMPEKVEIAVDYLSGDYSLVNSVETGRFESRCLARQGKPWDLMAWGFSGEFDLHGGRNVFTVKTPVQLKQEAAQVLPTGGGFQIYCTQDKDGWVNETQLDTMGEVAKFCREREGICFKSESVPQIGLFYSAENHYYNSPVLFSGGDSTNGHVKGLLNALLDRQFVADVVLEHQDFSRYPVIVAADAAYLSEGIRKKLLDYAESGGYLILAGLNIAEMFIDSLAVEKLGRIEKKPWWIELGGQYSLCYGETLEVAVKGSEILGYLSDMNSYRGNKIPAATKTAYGKGAVAAIYCEFGSEYFIEPKPVNRDFLANIVEAGYDGFIVKVTGSKLVDVSLTKKDGNMSVHLVNMGGKSGTKHVVFDEIVPIHGISVEVKCTKPGGITHLPSGTGVEFEYVDGKAVFAALPLEVHDIYVITD